MKSDASPPFSISLRPSASHEVFTEIVIRTATGSNAIFLPRIKGICYLLRPKSHRIAFSVKPDSKRARQLTSLETLRHVFINRYILRPKRKLTFGNLSIEAGGTFRARREFDQFLKDLPQDKHSVDGELLASEHLIKGWGAAVAPHSSTQPQIAPPLRTAVVCHLYYPELLEEIAALITSCGYNVDVIFTVPQERSACCNAIVKFLPNARIHLFENSGRDIRPFLKLLEGGVLDGYDVICKIHGKKSNEHGRSEFMGSFWRRHLFLVLLGNKHTLDEIYKSFTTDSALGLIGSETYRCPGRFITEQAGWGRNKETLLELASQLKIQPEDFRLDFFAGSMFWVRRAALEPLRKLQLADSYFSKESRMRDGAAEHAIERFFNCCVKAAGFRIATMDARSKKNSETQQ